MSAMAAEMVELRCPMPPGRLFARLRMNGDQPSYVHPDNLIEMACYDCRKRLTRAGQAVGRVLHRYDLAGNLVTTLVEEEHGHLSEHVSATRQTAKQPCQG